MRQYCRYCAYCVYGDAVWCSELEKPMSVSSAKATNNCKQFEFNEIDALGGDLDKKYKPREKKEKVEVTSPTLFD